MSEDDGRSATDSARQPEVVRFELDQGTGADAAAAAVAELGRVLGFGPTGRAELHATALLLSTACGAGAELIACPVLEDGTRGVDIVLIDRGRGAETRWTKGTGERAVALLERLGHPVGRHFSAAGAVLHLRLWAEPHADDLTGEPASPAEVGSLLLPAAGSASASSAWAADARAERLRLVLVEGAGPPALAAEAASRAIHRFATSPGLSPGDLVRHLVRTASGEGRPAVLVAEIDFVEGWALCAGCGRVAAALADDDGVRTLVEGADSDFVDEAGCPWGPSTRLVLGTRGLDLTRPLDPDELDGDTATLAAGAVLRDAAVQPDDLTVLVVRPRPPSTAIAGRLLAALPLEELDDLPLAEGLAIAAADVIGRRRDDVLAAGRLVGRLAESALAGEEPSELRVTLGPEAIVFNVVTAWDAGAGIADAPLVLAGPGRVLRSPALGLGSRPGHDLTERAVRRLTRLTRRTGASADLERANRRLRRTLAELRGRQADLVQLTRELEDRNRAVTDLSEELRTQAEELRRSGSAQKEVFATLAHEVRTPVYAIQGLLEMVLEERRDSIDEQLKGDLAIVDGATTELLTIVNEQLEQLKQDARAPALNLAAIEVDALLSSLRGMLAGLPRADGVELRIAASEPLPPLWTDPQKLTQVLRNLATNAIKFTQQGHVHVGAERRDEGHVCFFVTDTGPGIPPEDLERVFAAWEQSAASSATMASTGLGLPIARRLATAIDGELTLESEVGRGTTFRLTVPLRIAKRS